MLEGLFIYFNFYTYSARANDTLVATNAFLKLKYLSIIMCTLYLYMYIYIYIYNSDQEKDGLINIL